MNSAPIARRDRRALHKATRGGKGSARPATRRLVQPGMVRWLTPSDVVFDHADVVVIGGGATGIGLVWDLTLRGLDVILLEQAGLASGTSGAFHGVLHSGARYAGTDPTTAAQCLTESRILKAVARSFVRDTGGVFVRLEADAPDWEKRWLAGCRAAGLRTPRVPRGDILAREPFLSPRVVSAYRTPDAVIDGFGLLWSLLWSATRAGARAFFRARVTGFLTDEAGVRGVTVVGLGATEEEAVEAAETRGGPRVEPGEIIASVVVNATGPWVTETVGLAGPKAVEPVPVERDKGVMIVFNSPLASTIVSRLRPPGNGDIMVPHGPAAIFGTTSAKVEDCRRPFPRAEEVELLLQEGQDLFPTLDRVAPLRAYAGTRAVLRAEASAAGDAVTGRGTVTGRGGGRGFILIDHAQTDHLPGLVTVAGGKFTTFRAMAAATGDLVVRLLGKRVPSRTASVGIPRLKSSPATARPVSHRVAPGAPSTGLACECELVDLPYLEALLEAGLHLPDVRRLARVGMGGCQGVFCGQRLAGALWNAGWPGSRQRPRPELRAVVAEAEAFRRARLGGVKAVDWGCQARLSAMAEALDRLTLGQEFDGEAARQ